MQRTLKIIVVMFVFVIFMGCGSASRNKPSDALWNIVSKQCLAQGEYKNQKVNPCIHVDTKEGIDTGHVIFKDRVGVLQYLLMPTADISGMESPKLLKENIPNYFYLSWEARLYMQRKMRDKLNPEHASLAINSQFGRTQNHLHVHISCIKPDLKKQFDEHASEFKSTWSALPFEIRGHSYLAKKVTEKELSEMNVFKNMADEIEGAAQNMGEYGLAMIAVADKTTPEGYSLVLLASKRDVATKNRGSVEEIQDHECRIIFPL